MPRYFFNTRIGDELISDPEGEELRNPDRAWEVARAMIRELLKTEGAENGLLNAILEVTDGEGEIVLEFPFAERSFPCKISGVCRLMISPPSSGQNGFRRKRRPRQRSPGWMRSTRQSTPSSITGQQMC